MAAGFTGVPGLGGFVMAWGATSSVVAGMSGVLGVSGMGRWGSTPVAATRGGYSGIAGLTGSIGRWGAGVAVAAVPTGAGGWVRTRRKKKCRSIYVYHRKDCPPNCKKKHRPTCNKVEGRMTFKRLLASATAEDWE